MTKIPLNNRKKEISSLYFAALVIISIFVLLLIIFRGRDSTKPIKTMEAQNAHKYITMRPGELPSHVLLNSIITSVKDLKEEVQRLKSSLGEIAVQIDLLTNEFRRISTKSQNKNQKLVDDVDNKKISLHMAIMYGFLNFTEIQHNSIDIIDKIANIYKNSNLNEYQKLQFNMLVKEEVLAVTRSAVMENMGLIRLFVGLFTLEKLKKLETNKNFMRMTLFVYKLTILCYSPGDPKYDQNIEGVTVHYYKLDNVHCLNYSNASNVISSINYVYEINEDGIIVKERFLFDEDIPKIAKKGEIENLIAEKRKMRKIADEILNFVVEEKEQYDVDLFKEMAYDLMNCFLVIGKKINREEMLK